MRFTITSALLALVAAVGATDYTKCKCPTDLTGDAAGVHINQGITWYQCAYTGGACMWSGAGPLMNTAQDNCPSNAPCPSGTCTCPTDNNGDSGVYINSGTIWYQCAYEHGACMWDVNGSLLNTAQDNCQTSAKCTV